MFSDLPQVSLSKCEISDIEGIFHSVAFQTEPPSTCPYFYDPTNSTAFTHYPVSSILVTKIRELYAVHWVVVNIM